MINIRYTFSVYSGTRRIGDAIESTIFTCTSDSTRISNTNEASIHFPTGTSSSQLGSLMFSRTSSFTVLSRGCRYLLRPIPAQRASFAPFSLSARSFAAVNAAMADTSGVTAESLKLKLTEQLQAQHVEIEDLSGGYPLRSYFGLR